MKSNRDIENMLNITPIQDLKREVATECKKPVLILLQSVFTTGNNNKNII